MSSTPVTKRFYQEPDGRWYIDLPEYINEGLGDKANLEMVVGADTLLSNLAQGKSEIQVRFNEEAFDSYQIHLTRSSKHGYSEQLDPEDDPGGWYTIKDSSFNLWLCPVTLYVFNGCYPENIFIQVI